MTNKALPPTISVEQAGELLGVSRRSAYRAAARGQIPTVRIGRRLLVPTQRLLDLLGLDRPSPTNSDTEPAWKTTRFSTAPGTRGAFDVSPAHDGTELPDTTVGSMQEPR
jgi:excisionase family DNA binding protein